MTQNLTAGSPRNTPAGSGSDPGGARRAKRGWFVGGMLGVLAVGNLVHGLWITSASWANLTIISLVCLAPVAAIHTKGAPRRKVGTLLLLCFAFVPGFLSPAMNPGAGSKRLAIVLVLLGSILISFAVSGSRPVAPGFLVMLVAAAALVFAAQWLVPDPEFLLSDRRTPLGLNAIGAGRVMGLGAIVTMWYALRTKGLALRAVFVLVTITFIYGVVATGSRGPAAGAVVGCVVLFVVGTHLSRVVRALLVVMASASVGYAFVQLSSVGSRITSQSDSGRGLLLSYSWQTGLQNPAGIGWGNLFNYLPSSLVENDQGYNQYPHNLLVEFFSEAGVLGVVTVSIAIGMVLWRARRTITSTHGPALLALLVGALIGSMLSSDVVGNQILWVLCGIVLGSVTPTSAQATRGDEGVTPLAVATRRYAGVRTRPSPHRTRPDRRQAG